MSIRSSLPFFIFAILSVAARSDAQSTRLTADIPFDFTVHGREFPAGNYEVRLPDNASGVILIDNVRSHAAAFTTTYPSGGYDPIGHQPALVFDHRENKYVLAEVWLSETEGESIVEASGSRPAAHARTANEADAAYVLASKAP